MKEYFNKYFIKSSLIVAIFLSLPIYFTYFFGEFKFLNTIFVICGLYFLLKSDLKSYPLIGFFIGIFWFYWIGLSFRYYNLSYLIPFVIVGIGVIYGFIFFLISLLKNRILIALFFIFGFDYLSIFGFDWFKIDYLLVTTYFGVWKLNLISIFISLLFFIEKRYLISFLFILVALFYSEKGKVTEPNLKIDVETTNIPQNLKWKQNYIPSEINNVFDKIYKAEKNGYDVVILPETVFPFVLEKQTEILDSLKGMKISIIVGALSIKDNKYYNSTYLIDGNRVQILNKHILVPFGEYNPLPKAIGKIINKVFFDGAEDYVPSKNFGVMNIKGIKFLNAICYEATNEELYKQKEKYIVATSNDAWFQPSIEPLLQKIIIQFYVTKYHKMVFHSINGSKSYVVRIKE